MSLADIPVRSAPDLREIEPLARRLGVDTLDEIVRFPKYFEVETVNACNARCTMCTIADWDKDRNRLMSAAMFERFADECAEHAEWIEKICLNRDGEPTLDKHLATKIRMLKARGIRKVNLVTNGQLLDARMATALLEAGLDEVMFSIDGATAETFERIRLRLSFDTVVANALTYLALRDRINPASEFRVRIIEMPENRHEIAAWQAFWEPRVGPADMAYVMPMHSWGNQLFREGDDKVKRFARHPCVSVFSSMAIHADGSVGICAADYNHRFHAGSLAQQSVAEIWRGEAFTQFRQKHLHGARNDIELCRGCDIWDRDYKGVYR